MKNLNFVHLFLITIITIGIASCSNEELQSIDDIQSLEIRNEKMSSSPKVDSLKGIFVNIMKSDVYIAHRDNSLALYNGLKTNNTRELATRSRFQNFLTSNLGATNFTSVNQGLSAYDGVVISYDKLREQYSSFYVAISLLPVRDRGDILDLENPTPDEIVSFPIDNPLTPVAMLDCFDIVSLKIDALGVAYDEAHGPGLQGYFARIIYWAAVKRAIDDFNDCLAGV